MIRILVVDDEAKLTQSVCAYLNNSGYEAKGCLSAGAPTMPCTASSMTSLSRTL